jgi:hypothetical protein
MMSMFTNAPGPYCFRRIDRFDRDFHGSGCGIHHGADLPDPSFECNVVGRLEPDAHVRSRVEGEHIPLGKVNAGDDRIEIGDCEEGIARAEVMALVDDSVGESSIEGRADRRPSETPLRFGELLLGDILLHFGLVEVALADKAFLHQDRWSAGNRRVHCSRERAP